jgi:hypothetical protein
MSMHARDVSAQLLIAILVAVGVAPAVLDTLAGTGSSWEELRGAPAG